MVPGAGKMMKGIKVDDGAFVRIEAIINSMTPHERAHHAQDTFELEQQEELEKKLKKNAFDLEDFRDQLRQIRKMGNIHHHPHAAAVRRIIHAVMLIQCVLAKIVRPNLHDTVILRFAQQAFTERGIKHPRKNRYDVKSDGLQAIPR